MESFELYVFSFGFMGFDLCSFLSRVLIASELLLGLGLMSGIWRRVVNWSCASVLLAFSAFLLWRWLSGDDGSCHCFGDVLDMNPWQSLLKNLALAVLLAIGWNRPERDVVDFLASRLPIHKTELCRILATLLVCAASFSVVFATNPPSFYFRHRSHSNDLSEQLWRPVSDRLGLSEGRQAVLLFSPLCEHCQHCAAKISTILDRHDLDRSRLHVIFMTVTDNVGDMDKLIPAFYEKAGIAPFDIDTRILGYEEFIPMTDGIMPLVCFFDNASLLQEYGYSTLDEKAFVEFLLSGDEFYEKAQKQEQEQE